MREFLPGAAVLKFGGVRSLRSLGDADPYFDSRSAPRKAEIRQIR
ncbi:hypothetical protein SNL152K_5375 [Streptomyces sp. NL15-2K]|nr:hypothetical protein SNL152K_5375 [Streptomyces sp. NL15-2K]